MGKKYFKFKIKDLLTIKNIITIEYLNFPQNYKYGPESHNFWEMVYVDRESIFCTQGEKTIQLKKGELLFHQPNLIHSLYIGENNSASVFILCFETNSPIMNAFYGYKNTLNEQNKLILKNIIDETRNTFCYPFEKKLIVKKEPLLGGEEMISLYLKMLLIRLLREQIQSKDNNKIFLDGENYKHDLVGLIIEYMKAHISENLNISKICAHFCYSKSFLCKIFKDVQSESLISYFNRLKIEKAKKMLYSKKFNISQVAENLGFSDPHYFSSAFKKSTGLTPSQYIDSIL